MFVPDRDDLFRMLMSLLPSGRAWQTHDTAIQGMSAEAPGSWPGLPSPQPGLVARGSVMRAFLYAVAGPWRRLELAAAACVEEMFCATTISNRDQWLEEYGLPDSEDPYGDDFCAKARALAGPLNGPRRSDAPARYEAMALAIGWATEMRWLKGADPDYPGVKSTLLVVVDAGNSPALPNSTRVGGSHVGGTPLGTPSAARLGAIMDKIVPAHCAILLVVT